MSTTTTIISKIKNFENQKEAPKEQHEESIDRLKSMAVEVKNLTVAEIISDLTSLRACDYNAALALVSACSDENPANVKQLQGEKADDVDLQRAKDLVELHYSVKVAHSNDAIDQGLLAAREMVRKAVGS